MKLLTFQKHRFTADYWDFTTSTDAGGNERREHRFNKSIDCTVGTDGMMSRITIYTDEQLEPFGWLLNIRDRNGELVYSDDKTLVITLVEPRINVFGYAEGYRLRCS